MEPSISIGDHLVEKLLDLGVGHVFGIPGDYVLAFDKKLEESRLEFVTTCDEQGAGFAADAYARLNGLGAVCITYCVGGLKVTNTTAQAYAEKSPVVIISGSPGMGERYKHPLLHHMVKDFDTQLKVFQELTIASTVLDDPQTACQEIDRVLSAAVRYKRPVYIELPRDMVDRSIVAAKPGFEEEDSGDPHVLDEALAEAVEMINAAKRPVIIAGVEMHRFGLRDQLVRLLEKTNIPVASTILSKSVVDECNLLYMGIYEGSMGPEAVQEYVESSDCLILLGTFMTDINLGMYTARLDPDRTIYVTSERLSIRYHNYENVSLHDFLQGLIEAEVERHPSGQIPHPEPIAPFSAVPRRKMTVKRLFQGLNAFLADESVVIADAGDALFGGVDLVLGSDTYFLSPAYYASLGFAVPAAVGASFADPSRRPVVLVGDGSFQMTGIELSTVAKYGLNPIVLVLNNSGYGTERPMLDGSFNDLHPWSYSQLPEIVGGGKGFLVETEDEFEAALRAAQEYTEGFCLLEIILDPHDISPALQRLTASLAERVRRH